MFFPVVSYMYIDDINEQYAWVEVRSHGESIVVNLSQSRVNSICLTL